MTVILLEVGEIIDLVVVVMIVELVVKVVLVCVDFRFSLF